MARSISILPVRTEADLSSAKTLFITYAASIGVDLEYQAFATELGTMPGKYAPLSGELLLARNHEGVPIGCVGLRPISNAGHGVSEMKRLYVAADGRGTGRW